MRKRLWQIHSWLGLAAGLGLLVIGLTGSLLVFHEELEAVFNPSLVRVVPTEAGRLSLDRNLAEAERQLAGYEITGWHVREEGTRVADELYVIAHGTNEWLVATQDPYTGKVLASPRGGTTTLTGWLLRLHYEFFADHVGMFVAGLFGVALFLLGATGIWLYRDFWKRLFTLRWGAGARVLFSDLHKFTGISSALLNLLLGFTGAYWNLTHVASEWLHGEHEQAAIDARLYAPSLSLDKTVGDAAGRLPGFRANFISLPSNPSSPVVILWGAVEPRPWLRDAYGSTLSYDPLTGAHLSTRDIREQGLWTRIVDSFKPLHFGSFGGLSIKVLWALAGLAPGLLAVSGFCIWLCRRKK